MMTLTDFLLARIAEDEAWERDHGEFREAPNWVPPFWTRVKAECEAKRRIVELLGVGVPDPHTPGEDCNDCQVLYELALPYADHPDYNEEWRP